MRWIGSMLPPPWLGMARSLANGTVRACSLREQREKSTLAVTPVLALTLFDRQMGKERFPGLQNRESSAGRRRFGEVLAAAVQLLCGWRGLAAMRSIAAGCYYLEN